MRTNLTKKIISITVVALVVALVIATIVLACIPKKFTDPIVDNYASITVYKDGKPQQYRLIQNPETSAERRQNEVFKNIQKLHAESLKDNLLSAMFQGTGSFKTEVADESISISKITSDNKYVLVFTYLQEDLLLEVNGEVYRDETTLTSDTVPFSMLIVPLVDTSNFHSNLVYVAERTATKSNYQVPFLAHQSELYDYVASLEFSVI